MPRVQQHLIHLAACVLMAAACVQAAPGNDEPPTTQPEHAQKEPATGEPSDQAPPAWKMPDVRLTPMPAFDSDADYVRSIAAETTRLAKEANLATDPAKRVKLSLATANTVLARQLEPFCSRKLLGLDPFTDGLDEEMLRSALQLAETMIAGATESLKPTESEADSAEAWRVSSRQAAKALGAFATALHVYLLPEEGPGHARAARRAASGLSALLEDDRPAVAAAAMLWQASLRSREEDLSRAMSALDMALATPRSGTITHALFSRMLRCRLVARRGSPAAGITLLMQLEDRCEDWMTTDETRQSAIRALQLAQVQLLADWHDELSPKTQVAERAWCAERISILSEDGFSDKGRTVFRLQAAIPPIIASGSPPRPADGARPDGK